MNDPRRTADPAEYIFLPPKAALESMNTYAALSHSGPVLDFGHAGIDARINPLLPGDLMSVIARPGMGKTSLMAYLAKRWATMAELKQARSLVLYSTWETLVEEFVGVITAGDSGQTLEDIGRGRADMSAIRLSMGGVLGSSFAIVGRSRTTSHRGLLPPTLSDLHRSVEWLSDQGWNVAAIFVDYLQRIPGSNPATRMEDRSSRVSENLELCKDLALRHACAIVVGVQARREVDDHGGLKMPAIADAQWSSVVEQTSDKVLGLSIPSKHMSIGDDVVVAGNRMSITANSMAVQLLKQRFGAASHDDMWLVDFDAARLELSRDQPLSSSIF